MLTQTAYDIRRIARGVSKDNEATDRYVDIGVDLKVVRADDNGQQYLPGTRKMTILREYNLGGILDTKANPPRILEGEAGWSKNPQTWYCSEDQERIILHPDSEPVGKLALGGMGAGKTTAGIMWLYMRWLENIGTRKEIGITAPTETRLSLVLNELFRMWPSHWFSFNSENKIATLADGFRLRGVSTHRQSAAAGSRVQAFNWIGLLSDELQDSIAEFEHMMARLRSKEDGRSKWLAPSTAKDASDWREKKDQMVSSGDWTLHQLLGPNSPFVSPDHWGRMKRIMSPRDYRRLVLAEDMPPELAVYYGWLRARNLVARPQIARDVTASVLSQYRSYIRPGAPFTLLAGHDPGVIFNTTEILRLLMFRDVPTWVVVGELQTKQTTAREHAAALATYVRKEFGVEYADGGGKMLTFIDPHGKGEGQTDYQSVYMAFQKEGLDAFNPASMSGRIKRTARVEMMNRLLGGSADNAGVPRLVVATDEQHRAVAPRLVESLESLKKRPGDDDPEGRQTKNEDDKTHCPVAAAYALWMFEQEAFTEQTIATARRA